MWIDLFFRFSFLSVNVPVINGFEREKKRIHKEGYINFSYIYDSFPNNTPLYMPVSARFHKQRERERS